MYQSNYVAGLRVVDVNDPVNPVEVGYFDTVPFGENLPGFAGSWSNYPYFKSGVVAATSMREGLFLVRYQPSDGGAVTCRAGRRRLAVCSRGAAAPAGPALRAQPGRRHGVGDRSGGPPVLRTLDLRRYGVGDNAKPHHIQVEPDGSAWYVTLIGAGKVLKLDPSGRVLGSVEMEVPGLIALHPTKDLMFVGRSMSAVNPPPRMAVIRRSDMKLLDEVDLLFPRPHGIVVHPAGDVVYVASLGTNQIASVGVEEGEVQLVNVPGAAHGFVQAAVSPDGRLLAVTAELTDSLLIFDLAKPSSPRLVRGVAMPDGPFEPTFTRDGRLDLRHRAQRQSGCGGRHRGLVGGGAAGARRLRPAARHRALAGRLPRVRRQSPPGGRRARPRRRQAHRCRHRGRDLRREPRGGYRPHRRPLRRRAGHDTGAPGHGGLRPAADSRARAVLWPPPRRWPALARPAPDLAGCARRFVPGGRSRRSPWPTPPAGRVELPFIGGFNAPRPQLVDADGDGDLDLFLQELTGSVALYERDGEAERPAQVRLPDAEVRRPRRGRVVPLRRRGRRRRSRSPGGAALQLHQVLPQRRRARAPTDSCWPPTR